MTKIIHVMFQCNRWRNVKNKMYIKDFTEYDEME